jgi:hypothetical protein
LKSFDNIKDICQFEAIENNGCPETIPFNRTCKDFVSKDNSLGKKDNSDSSNESHLDTQNITREENKSEHMLVGVDNHPDKTSCGDNWVLDKQIHPEVTDTPYCNHKSYILTKDVKLFLKELKEEIANEKWNKDDKYISMDISKEKVIEIINNRAGKGLEGIKK